MPFRPYRGKFLRALGVWDKIFPYIGKYRDIYLSDADNPKIVKFKTADLGMDFLGFVGEHTIYAEGRCRSLLARNVPT